MSWTAPQDITDRFIGDEVTLENDVIQTLIDDTEALILKQYPAIQGRIDSNALPIRIVQQVVARVVIAYIKSEGSPFYMQSQSVGGYSRSVTLSSTARTSIKLTAEDINDLAPTTTSQALQLDLTANSTLYNDVVWVDIKEDND